MDTSSALCSVAIGSEDGLHHERSEDIGRGHAERLLPMLTALMQKSGAAYEQISAIGVTTGPGSFTGVRVGLSVARALSLALRIPSIGISTFHGLMEEPQDPLKQLILIDAKRGETYGQLFTEDPLSPSKQTEPFVLSEDKNLPQAIQECGPVTVVGSPSQGTIARLREEGVPILNQVERASPRIQTVFQFANWIHASGNSGAFPPKPLYLRGPDAKPQNASLELEKGMA